MNLEYDKFPDFYKKYKWVPQEEENPELFTGRLNYMQNFWRDLCNLAGKGMFGRQNRAFIGPRKLGKTAFLRRCYNVSFWEQSEVLPFYYCFQQTDVVELRNKAREVALDLVKQAVGFVLKDPTIFSIKSEKAIWRLLKKRNDDWLELLQIYWEECMEKIDTFPAHIVMEKVWDLVDGLGGLFSKKVVLIIDEYQKTLNTLMDNGKIIPSHESIGVIVNYANISVILSGSQISLLANHALTAELLNRVPSETFFPLKKRDAHELVKKYTKGKDYPGIEDDVYKLVGGNPYYIKMLFSHSNIYDEEFDEPKRWKSFEGIQKSYNFEVLHRRGNIFRFWDLHIADKHRLLNGDPPENKGLTIKILQYIAEQEDGAFLYKLKEKFPEVVDLEEKMLQLREADLIEYSIAAKSAYHFSDVVLPVVLKQMHQEIFFGKSNEKAMEKYKAEWFAIQEQRMRGIESSIQKSEANLKSLEKGVHSLDGKKNLKQGLQKESEIRQKLSRLFRKSGKVRNYRLEGDIQSAKVGTSSGRGREIDAFAVLKKARGKKRYALIGEVKNRKTKAGSADAKKFIQAIHILTVDRKLDSGILFYFSSSGFSKPAQQLLEENDVVCVSDFKSLQKSLL